MLFIGMGFLLAAPKPKFYPFQWASSDSAFRESLPEKITLFKPQNIQIKNELQNRWEAESLPFFSENLHQLFIRMHFNLPANADSEEVYLYCGGFVNSADIRINGQHAFFAINDLTPLHFKIPPELIKSGDNSVEIRLVQPVSIENGYPHYVRVYSEERIVGLIRPLYLYIKPNSIISEPETKVSKDLKSVQISYGFNLPAVHKNYILEELITSSSGKKILYRQNLLRKNKRRRSLKFTIRKSSLWSPENPGMNRLQVWIKANGKTVAHRSFLLGFRRWTVHNNTLLFNNSPLLIRGVNFHLNPHSWLSKNRVDQIGQDLVTIKEMGFNAIRFPHYIPDESILRAADSTGILLFAELPVWRYPGSLFTKDLLLSHMKASLQRMQGLFAKHPSLMAVSIGQEIPLDEAPVQKFMFILKRYIKEQVRGTSYLSPIPGHQVPVEVAADFYESDFYYPFNPLGHPIDFHAPTILIGNLGIPDAQLYREIKKDPTQIQRRAILRKEWIDVQNTKQLQGGFIESYRDWIMSNPNNLSLASDDPLVNHSGLFTLTSISKPWSAEWNTFWNSTDSGASLSATPSEKNNFFSLLIVFSTIFFFLIYRRQARLKENFQRARIHPYGFFVDMRERRIIPLFNSFLVGSFSSLILAVYIGSFFYFYRGSILLQELVGLFLIPAGLFTSFLKLNNNAGGITGLFFVLLLSYPLLVSFILKFISILTGNKIRFRQALAIGLWSGVPLIYLLPFSLFNYQILQILNVAHYQVYLLLFFVIWAHFRIINGIRVLFITRIIKVFIYMLLSYIIPLIILFAVFNPVNGWFSYLNLLIHSGSLF